MEIKEAKRGTEDAGGLQRECREGATLLLRLVRGFRDNIH